MDPVFTAFFGDMEPQFLVKRLIYQAEFLDEQFKREGGRYLIDEAIALAREALELCPPDNLLMQADCLTDLSVYLSDRYEHFGDMKDMEEGIGFHQISLQLRPAGHPHCHMSLGSLGCLLSARYDQLGATDDLDDAIAMERQALACCPPGHHYRKIWLSNLSNYLRKRYENLGAMEDLDECISCGRDSLAFCPQDHPFRSYPLNNLAAGLQFRYIRLRAIEDLNEAIVLNREALGLRPLGHPRRPISLNNLSNDLHMRYEELGKINDLDEAIVLAQEALDLHQLGHPLRSESLNNLSVRLHMRYEKLGNIDDLNKAIALDEEALRLCPLGHPHRSLSLRNLAAHLRSRFSRSHQSRDKKALFHLYTQLVDVSHTVSSTDLFAAQDWIRVAEDFEHSTIVLAYETYIRLLLHHLAALPSLSRHLDIVKILASSFAQDAFSAALRIQSLTKAVELLEQGRGVFLNQLARLRSPVDDVMASGADGKTLGNRFLQLTSDIHKTLQSSSANQHDRVCHLNVQLQGVISNIRNLPSFTHFLLPLPFPQLREAAIHGPVIIVNASRYSCDALVVFFDRDPVHIPLKISRDEVRDMASELHRLTMQTKIKDMGKYFAVVMRDLWNEIVSSIVDVLKTNHPLHSRIWWCPTSEFSVIPLHAAGMYRTGQPKFSDFYISSYTSSLAALIHARQHQLSESLTERKRFVGIGQGTAAGESELYSIADELTAIEERVDGLAVFRRMEGSESSITEVMEALGQNEWVHLACHGLPNKKEPFESAFGLYDGHLTIERILRCNLRNAEFAYLSACHTTVGDEDCLDEMIHLASAMQFAGFRSVIGTMWAVDDEQTVKITSKFYEKMVDESGCLDHTRAAYALHQTMRKFQGLPFDQRILYVHYGA